MRVSVVLVLLLGACTMLGLVRVRAEGSDAPRGVALGFVFDPKAECEPRCEHGGVCVRNNTCFCSGGYEGETCQYASCFPKCKNGGECLRPGKCRCPPGFGGRYCHKVTCEGGCWNRGECTAVNGVVKCICPSSWTGSSLLPSGLQERGCLRGPGNLQLSRWMGGWSLSHCRVLSAVCERRKVRLTQHVPLSLLLLRLTLPREEDAPLTDATRSAFILKL
ncbi:von Willebrand factor D and EGF domain-containing protein isoform X1 [Gouania willdenowi]|uniref:von Willebrand factor D and EGF domain-containing protein isoform X1 n=1 Tax=Gouania willdenowi TaxID=441366 RepID=UPI001054538D|nr:wnt inhibitory factor 1-like isoform X1 [Gouania willdenowi]